jgi:hypothetical protein
MPSILGLNILKSCEQAVDNMFSGCGLYIQKVMSTISGVQKSSFYTSLRHNLSTTLYHYFYSLFKKSTSFLYTLSTRPITRTIYLNYQLLYIQEDKS